MDDNGTNLQAKVVVVIRSLFGHIQEESSAGATDIQKEGTAHVIKGIPGPVGGQHRRLLEFGGQGIDMLTRSEGILPLGSDGELGVVPGRHIFIERNDFLLWLGSGLLFG